jgi:hypothetical protein
MEQARNSVHSGFGSLVVSMLASRQKPSDFSGEKILIMPSF